MRRPGYFETAPLPIFMAAAFAGGLLLCWPLLLHGGPLLFFDSAAYLSGGQRIVDYIYGIFVPANGSGTKGAVQDVEQVGLSIRSIFYSLYVYVTSRTPIGYSGPVLIQAMLIAALLLLLVPARSGNDPWRWTPGIIALLLLTPLPFYASLLMPDLLAAAVILAGLIFARGAGARATFVAFVALTAAIASHYGNLPLAAFMMSVAALWMLIRRRLDLWRLAALTVPFIIAAGINVVGGAVAFDNPSVAPRRLPILLARSLEDGPARWHLRDHCAEHGYAICTALENIPENVGAALWQKGGIGDIQSARLMDEIRAEEGLILRRAFMEYPTQQSWSLLRNFAMQLVRFGLSDVYSGRIVEAEGMRPTLKLDQKAGRGIMDALEIVHVVAAAISLIYLLRLLLGSETRLGRDDAFMIWFVFIGLLANAAIFGGLSAPVDRYQGRVVWLVTFLAVLFWARRDRSV